MGPWVDDKKWGRQFKVVDSRIRSTPKTVLGIERFLGSGLIPGIGPSLAKRIVEKFGKDTLDVIDKTPTRLTEVIGHRRPARGASSPRRSRRRSTCRT